MKEMTEIGTKKEFLAWLSKLKQSDDLRTDYIMLTNYRPRKNLLRIKSIEIKSFDFKNIYFECTEFQSCTFINCDFTHSILGCSTFIKCKFENCDFTWSKFIEADLLNSSFDQCVLIGLEFCDVVFDNTSFNNCSEILDLRIAGNWNRTLSFNNSYIAFAIIEPIGKESNESFVFTDCIIERSCFKEIDFSNSLFKNNVLSLNTFSNCKLTNQSLCSNNNPSGKEYNLLDIRTIINSENIKEDILSTLFGVYNSGSSQ